MEPGPDVDRVVERPTKDMGQVMEGNWVVGFGSGSVGMLAEFENKIGSDHDLGPGRSFGHGLGHGFGIECGCGCHRFERGGKVEEGSGSVMEWEVCFGLVQHW
ncbi:hypothetical protein HanIR_Chr10g0453421 [Helianthus annuus]|nr:hypothetical protein HanIR_Chr10g0453421 [Helianthus annuus]